MAITITEVRQKYPQYTDLSDKQLADALHKKYYSDIPINNFYNQIGLTQKEDLALEQLEAGLQKERQQERKQDRKKEQKKENQKERTSSRENKQTPLAAKKTSAACAQPSLVQQQCKNKTFGVRREKTSVGM